MGHCRLGTPWYISCHASIARERLLGGKPFHCNEAAGDTIGNIILSMVIHWYDLLCQEMTEGIDILVLYL